MLCAACSFPLPPLFKCPSYGPDVLLHDLFHSGNSISGHYKDQYWYGGQSTGSGSGNTIGSHNAQSG